MVYTEEQFVKDLEEATRIAREKFVELRGRKNAYWRNKKAGRKMEFRLKEITCEPVFKVIEE